MRPEGGFQGGKSNTFEMYKYVKLSGSNFSAHAWCNIHSIDCNNSRVIDKEIFRIRKSLDSWYTAKTNETDNNSKPLPKQYSILLH